MLNVLNTSALAIRHYSNVNNLINRKAVKLSLRTILTDNR